MIGLDTNILVRLFARDDAGQFEQALNLVRALTPKRPGFIARETLQELVWVLQRRFGKTSAETAELLSNLLHTENVVIEAEADMAAAVQAMHEGADFADLMILAAARNAGCETLFTFDRKLARHDGVTLMETA